MIPLDLLGEEQKRIARRLAFLDAQIEAGDIEYEPAQRAGLDNDASVGHHRTVSLPLPRRSKWVRPFIRAKFAR